VRGRRVGIRSWCWATSIQLGPRRGCQVVFIESYGWLDEVLYEHAWRGLFVTRPESGKGVGHLIVASEDMMNFKTVKLLIKLSYLLEVCHHAGVATIQLPHDLVDDELRAAMDVKSLDPELGGDA
jgi:hypothetical protein